MKNRLRQGLVMLGLLGLLVAMPLSGYGADLTIGNAITVNGSLSGNGSGLTNLNPANLSAGTAGINISGNAATATTVSGTISSSNITNLIVDTEKSNSAFGYLSLTSNTGYYNTAFGDSALNSNTSGVKNTAVGMNALVNSISANEDTAVGESALMANETGSYNTAVGVLALSSNVDGNNNTASGDSALLYNTTGDDNTAVGTIALASNSSGNENTAIGFNSLVNNTTGSQNTAIGKNAGFKDGVGGALVNSTAIGYNARVDGSNKVLIGNTAVTWIGGQVTWSNTSDIRAKKDIQDISRGLDFINSLRPVEYRMKQGNDRIDFGFIAQDIEELLGTEYNVLGIGEDEAHTLSLRYTDFIAPMVKAMQEQQQIIRQMQKELDELKALVLSMTNK